MRVRQSNRRKSRAVIDIRIALLIAVIYGGIWATGKVVEGVHKVNQKIEHVAKSAGHKLAHVVTFGKK